MAYKIAYKASVQQDLRKLDKGEASRILNKLEKDLGKDPNIGQPLKGPFQGLFRYRVGDYRVIYTKTREGVLVLRIGHRRDVYR
ncbi:MAG: type II toxin-antitoxin system RelE/ParE family toxin [Actinomycetota bacterium]